MAKATLKERIQKSIRSQTGTTLRRFVEGPVRSTQPVQRTVRQGSVDVEARTLTAVVATGQGRILHVYDDDLDTWLQVEEVINVAGMDLSRVATGLQFLDNHRTDDRIYNLGVVNEARLEEVDGADAVVVDIKISSRSELDSVVQDLADGILGCISCQYTPDETTLELREGQLPLLTVVKSTLLEVSLVSVPADPSALVRSKFSLKGQDMAPKPKTNARAEEGALDEAAIAAIVQAAIEEATPVIVEETLAAARAEGGAPEMTDEEKAAAEAAAAEEAKKAEEEKAAGGGDATQRSFIRSLVAKSFGRSAPSPKAPDLSQVRSIAQKYGVTEFDGMAQLPGVTESELRSFVLNATASRSGTGATHDGRNKGGSNDDLTWANSARGKRAAAKATRR